MIDVNAKYYYYSNIIQSIIEYDVIKVNENNVSFRASDKPDNGDKGVKLSLIYNFEQSYSTSPDLAKIKAFLELQHSHTQTIINSEKTIQKHKKTIEEARKNLIKNKVQYNIKELEVLHPEEFL